MQNSQRYTETLRSTFGLFGHSVNCSTNHQFKTVFLQVHLTGALGLVEPPTL